MDQQFYNVRFTQLIESARDRAEAADEKINNGYLDNAEREAIYDLVTAVQMLCNALEYLQRKVD